MKISRVGGIIAAANPELSFPLKQIGSISAVKRIALLYKQAGIFPIVVLTGAQDDEVRYQLSANGVVFLPVAGDVSPELFLSAKTGFSFLKNKCEKIIFTPVNVPFVSASTIGKLIETEGEIIIPSFQNRGGHPIVLASDILDKILEYEGSGGLRGALSKIEIVRNWVEVSDSGVLRHAEIGDADYDIKQQLFHLVNSIGLEREVNFFSGRAKLLLLLISHTHSVRGACDLMALSYSKGWAMINQLEKELGFVVVQRKHGGNHGGRTDLTPKGYLFLMAYQKMEEDIFHHGRHAFNHLIESLGDNKNI